MIKIYSVSSYYVLGSKCSTTVIICRWYTSLDSSKFSLFCLLRLSPLWSSIPSVCSVCLYHLFYNV